jgi:diaminohydroxyphosphoribosylaminopyrimidine deaminase/5-amino-6-(5-phosphoribosylamino)uracil reductase
MYEKYITTKEPFVVVKAALSADGKMSDYQKKSKWISGEESRKVVQELRSQVDAIMAGINTILEDDPQLTARIPGASNPIRIIIDPKLKIPSIAKVLDKDADTIIFTTDQAPLTKANAMRARGIDGRMEQAKNGKLNLKKLIKELGKEEITSIMIEGGGETIGNAFDAGIVDKVMLFISPKILGGKGTIISGNGFSIDKALMLERVEMKRIGEDFLMTGYPQK